MEETMKVVLFFETSQPCGKFYRFGFGCTLPPELVSMIFVLAGLIK